MFGYWKRLWNAHPLIFMAVLVWVFGQVWATRNGAESFPFYNYGMYSQPAKREAPSASAYLLFVGNENVYPRFQPGTRDFLSRNLDYFFQEWPQDSLRILSNIDSRFSRPLEAVLQERFRRVLLPDAPLEISLQRWLCRRVEERIGNVTDTLFVIRKMQTRTAALNGEIPLRDTLWIIPIGL